MTGVTVPGVYIKFDLSIQQFFDLQSFPIEKIRIFSSRVFDHINIDPEMSNLIAESFRILGRKDKKIKIHETVESPAQVVDEW